MGKGAGKQHVHSVLCLSMPSTWGAWVPSRTINSFIAIVALLGVFVCELCGMAHPFWDSVEASLPFTISCALQLTAIKNFLSNQDSIQPPSAILSQLFRTGGALPSGAPHGAVPGFDARRGREAEHGSL